MANALKQFTNFENVITGTKVILLLIVAAVVWFLLILLFSQFVDLSALSTGWQIIVAVLGLLVQLTLLGYIARTFFKIK